MNADEIALRAASQLLAEFLKSATAGLRKAASKFYSHSQAEDLLANAGRKYAHHLVERHSRIKILGMSKPVRLANLYTDVLLLEKIPSRRHAEPIDLARFLESGTGIFHEQTSTVPAADAVDKNERLVVLGKPGAGKTTLLRHIVIRDIQGGTSIERLPIFVSLHELANRKVSIRESIERDLIDAGLDGPEFLSHLLLIGKAFLLLDGLDEVGSVAAPALLQEITELSTRFPASKFVVTCRTAVYASSLQNFVDVEIADFSAAQIHTFVNNWFAEAPDRARSCWDDIKHRPNIFQLATTPLLAALVCVSYEDKGAIADTRADLYRDAIDVLLRKWDASRLITREQSFRTLSPSKKETLLSFLAAQMFNDERYFFTYEAAREAICNYVLHLEDVDEDEVRDDATAMLQAIEGQHGILVTRAKGIYSFAHLTFQEYFTAVFLSRAERDLRSVMVDKHLADARWREVLILVAHLLPAADDYVVAMLKKLCNLGIDISHYRALIAQRKLLQTEQPTIEEIFREPRGIRPMMASSADRDEAKRILDDILRIAPSPKLLLISVREMLVECVGAVLSAELSYGDEQLDTENVEEGAKDSAIVPRGAVEKAVADIVEFATSLGFAYHDWEFPASIQTIRDTLERLVDWAKSLTDEALGQLDSALLEFAKPAESLPRFLILIESAVRCFEAASGRFDLRNVTLSWVSLPPPADARSYERMVKSAPSRGYFERYFGERYHPPSDLLQGAAVLAEILSAPVFLRKETRRAALLTLRAFPFQDPAGPGGGRSNASALARSAARG